MRRPSGRCQPHRCLLRFNTWETDQDGGRQVASYTESDGIPCFVQPGTTRLVIDDSDGTGTRRVTEQLPTKVYFVDNPALNTEDLIYWAEDPNETRSHWFKVLSLAPPCGTSVLWVVETCEHR